jgi:hypothetical protein
MTGWKKQLADQVAHFFLAFVIVYVAQQLGAAIGVPAGAFIGFCYGLLREVTEWQCGHRDPFTPRGLLDISFWTLGGAAGGRWP